VALARRYWPNEDPIGKRMRVIFSPWLTVVGVVGNSRQISLDAEPQPELYLSDLQEPQAQMSLVARAASDPSNLVAAAREQVWALDKNLPVTNVKNLSQFFSDSVAQRRFNAILLGLFAAVALLLAAIGIYGVMSYTVSQRTQEIGVRIALGANPGDVVRMVVGRGLRLILIGTAAGLALSAALTRLMSALLFDVSATDPLTYALVTLLLVAVALLACYVPARRAAAADPLVALRCE
jgi:putative ABC transport system permease protein